MLRTPCPTCTCGFKEDTQLYSSISSSGVAQSLRKIRSKSTLSQFFHENNIFPAFRNNEWFFGLGICTSVVNKFRKKIEALGIQPPNYEPILDPASDPDDEPPKASEISGAPGTLSFDEEEDNFLTGKKAWNPLVETLNLDE
ncbi:hypothetical protein KBD33_05535 [Candidatus Gracilibacteria bacterium]|nr:hypothetical protein [Candidatus Gracilibacteria bacterium]